MAIRIEPYHRDHEPAVVEFNCRLQTAHDPALVFSQSSVPRWLPPASEHPVWNEFYVARDGEAVRGAYALKQEAMFVRGKGEHRIACYHHPLSEGVIDRAYTSVGILLARDALARQPFLYALGMGGAETPIAKMLKALGFTLTPIPFYFHVVNSTAFLREMKALRENHSRAQMMDIAAASGIGSVGIKVAQAFAGWRSHSAKPSATFTVDEVAEFSDADAISLDELWSGAKEAVSFATVRDAKTMRLLYPAHTYLAHVASTRKLRVSRDGRVIGWAIIGIRRKDAKFGEMRVGSMVDCWAKPEDAATVIRAASDALEKDNVDLIVSNQSHQAWQSALERAGFLKGPTNFIFATSKKLSELLGPSLKDDASFHVTRADGDGLPANF